MVSLNVGMLFAMIFTIIVIGVIIALGFGQIQQFFCFGSNSQTVKAVNDIESMVNEMFVLAKGSAKTYRVGIPSDTKICFVNPSDPTPRHYHDSSMDWEPDSIILNEFLLNTESSSYGSNIWVYFCDNPLGDGKEIDYLSPSNSFCAVGGKTILLTNEGSSVDISIPE